MIEFKQYDNEEQYIIENYNDFRKIDKILKYIYDKKININIELLHLDKLKYIINSDKYLDGDSYDFPCNYVFEMYRVKYNKVTILDFEGSRENHGRDFNYFYCSLKSDNGDCKKYYISSPMLDIDFINNLLNMKIKFKE